ncbi:MAG: saccharopine dehydrogenase family protein [Marinirhabdus sp.]
MRNILIIGAGRSATSLIQYLLDRAKAENIFLTIGDRNPKRAQKLLGGHPNGCSIPLDASNDKQRRGAVRGSDLIISMLPHQYHIKVAQDCIALGKHLVTASYVGDEMQALDATAKEKKLVFMNEIGLDPGIDHMSAMHMIDRIRAKGGKMVLFESFTGGLMAPESDTNLWNYKFTWNPRNVVLAGQGGAAEFIHQGDYKYIPYNRIFRRTEFIEIEGYGKFEAYANRKSLKYQSVYGLENILTLYRGTIRRPGFSRAWNIFVTLGMTDDSYTIPNSENLSYREFVNMFLPYSPNDSVELKLGYSLKIDQDDLMWEKLIELDIFNPNKTLGIKDATPAKALQKILEDKWTLLPEDKDMIVMYHKFGYELNGKKHQIDSNMVITGDDQTYTAMAKTVGLPVAIAALKILNGGVTAFGVQRPIAEEMYVPILKELETFGITFKETEVEYLGYNPSRVLG